MNKEEFGARRRIAPQSEGERLNSVGLRSNPNEFECKRLHKAALASANEFIINFDESSNAWRQNKIKLANGCYKYKTLSPIVTRQNSLKTEQTVVLHRYNTRSSVKI